MRTHTRFAILSCFLAVACSSGGGGPIDGQGNTGGNETPVPEGQVTSPTSSIQVTASLSAVTLGDDCGGGGSGSGFAAGDSSGKCAQGSESCGGGCQQSNMQLQFTATAAGQTAKIEIGEVTLHDDAGNKLDTLTSSSPKSWNGSAYAPWDQTVAPSATLKTSYNLSAPAWSKIGSTSSTNSGGAGLYSRQYRLRVSVRIDGVNLLLESTALRREPAVAT